MRSEIRRILVPLDGSRLAESALPAALGWGERLGAEVTLLHVLERNPPQTVHGQAHLNDAEEARRYLEEVAARLGGSGVPVHVHVPPQRIQDVAGGIVAQARELGADLIAISTHGWGGLRDLLVGNIAQQIVRSGSVPVLLLRPGPNGGAPPFGCGDVLVAFDPIGHDASALLLARRMVDACGARLHLVAVVPTPGSLRPERRAAGVFLPQTTRAELELERRDVEARLREVIGGDTAGAGDGIATLQILRGDPVQQVAGSLARTGADLLVLATHGRAGLGGWLTGSFAPRILAKCSVPVLFVRIA